MKRASITDAKNRLSALIDRVRHGETVIIEDRGVPVAQLAPVGTARALPDRDRVARLERQGVLRPARIAAAASPMLLTAPPSPARPVSLSQMVFAERSEGW